MNEPENQYAKYCKDKFTDVILKLDSLNNRLFVDNGTECLQSKINRHDKLLTTMTWALGIAYVTLLSIMGYSIRVWLASLIK